MQAKIKKCCTSHKNQHRPSRKLQSKWIIKEGLEQMKKKKYFRGFSLKMPHRKRVYYHDNRFKFPCLFYYVNEKDRKHDININKIPQEHICAYYDFKGYFSEYSDILYDLYNKMSNIPKEYINKGYLNYVKTGWVFNPHYHEINKLNSRKSKENRKNISILESSESSIFQAYSSYKYNI